MRMDYKVNLKLFNMKYKIFYTFLIVFFALSATTYAQVPIAKPFGGRILFAYECTCSGGWLMMVFDQTIKTPTPITFQFGYSMLRANYNIFTPAAQTVGTYTPGGICLMGSTACTGFPTAGTITPVGLPGVGTSVI